MLDDSIFTDLYSQYIELVYRYIISRVGNVQVAEDLTAETFLAVLEGLPRFRVEAPVASWVMAIAHHKIADYFRKERDALPLEAELSIASAEPSPHELADQRLQLENVVHALHFLSPDRGDALALFFFAGLDVHEVALVMAKSEAAIRMLIYRGLQDLRTRLIIEKRG